MKSDIRVVKQFEHGTLLERLFRHRSSHTGAHAYYVPNRARRDIGMRKVKALESSERAEYFSNNGGPDWEAIEGLTTTIEIVELAAELHCDRVDGDVSDVEGTGSEERERNYYWSSGEPTTPPGVIRFCDPAAHEEDAITRPPFERGYCWGVLKDRTYPTIGFEQVVYDNDARLADASKALVPTRVIRQGSGAMVAFLAAHDHSNGAITHALGLEPDVATETVANLTAGLTRS